MGWEASCSCVPAGSYCSGPPPHIFDRDSVGCHIPLVVLKHKQICLRNRGESPIGTTKCRNCHCIFFGFISPRRPIQRWIPGLFESSRPQISKPLYFLCRFLFLTRKERNTVLGVIPTTSCLLVHLSVCVSRRQYRKVDLVVRMETTV